MQNYVNESNSIDIDELLAAQNDETVTATSNASDSGVLVVTDDENLATSGPETTISDYSGPGAVIDRSEIVAAKKRTEANGIQVDGIRSDVIDDTKKYMAEMDQTIEVQRKKFQEMKDKGLIDPNTPEPEVAHVRTFREAMKENPETDQVSTPAQEVSQADPKPQDVVNIYIDRAQVGELIFTPEQQKKLDFASKINIVEVTKSKFSSIKIKRFKIEEDKAKENEAKRERLTIINKAFDRTLSPFIAIGSGYLGKMGNCSVADVMKLGRQIDSGENLNSELERWQLLYDKMKYCSIGKFKSFDEFLKNTAYDDYDNLYFALISASFPDKSSIDFTCNKCKHKFTETFSNKDLLITDNINDETMQTVQDIVNADTFIERAKEVHANALFNTISRIAINDDDLSILVDLYSPSAYDAIYRTYQDLTDPRKDDQIYEAYARLVKYVRAVYVATDEEDGEFIYTEFTDSNDVFNIMSHFSDIQLNKIGLYMSESYLSHRYNYGLKNITCPQCKAVLGDYPVAMDTLLFLKVRPQ